jgi:hypothetical protein
MTTASLLIALAPLAMAQSSNPLIGSWKLNVEKSQFLEREDASTDGTREYAFTPDGVRVRWKMSDADGKLTSGEYVAQCKDRICVSDRAQWEEKGTRTAKGKTFVDGVVSRMYTRVVSKDGKRLTITFFRVGSKKPTAVQVWDRQ